MNYDKKDKDDCGCVAMPLACGDAESENYSVKVEPDVIDTPQTELKPEHDANPSIINTVYQTNDVLVGSESEWEDVDDEGQSETNVNDSIKSPQIQYDPGNTEVKIVKYQINDVYSLFIQKFTLYCENKTELLFDASIFFDDDFFPSGLYLTDFVPINVIAPNLEKLGIFIPVDYEYCESVQCSPSLFQPSKDELEYDLRSQVDFILRSIQCPRIRSFTIESFTSHDASHSFFHEDRLSTWNDSISFFVSRHAKTLNKISLELTRHKSWISASYVKISPKSPHAQRHPKLHELTVTLWAQTSPDAEDDIPIDNDTTSTGLLNWIPDPADQYLLSLAKSQLHGVLTKLCWTAPASLELESVFQSVLDSNGNSLESLSVIDVDGLSGSIRKISSHNSPRFPPAKTVLECTAFATLHKLKSLSLRKFQCYLTCLNMLPKGIEEIAIEDMYIESKDISCLRGLERLKTLRLFNVMPPPPASDSDDDEAQDDSDYASLEFGVDRENLKDLLSLRHLQELSIFRHRLDFDIDILSDQSYFKSLNALVEKVNYFLVNICRSPQSIVPNQFSKRHREKTMEDKELFESLQQIGHIDEQFLVISLEE